MRETALDLDDNRLVLLVAYHDTLKNSPWHDFSYLFSASFLFQFGAFVPLLRRKRFYPCDIAAHRTHPRRIFELTCCPLKAQVELLLPKVQELLLKLIVGHNLKV